MTDEHRIHLERVYDEVRARKHSEEEPPPGERFLVDRVWPRGVSKDAMADVTWLKDVAPGSDLRTWFGHDPDRFEEFAERYRTELEENSGALEPLLKAAERGRVTLLYAAKDTEHNHAIVLRDHLETLRGSKGSKGSRGN
ncbi:DUF488 domain-containing protein [Nocardiopsis sp. NPDC055551]|uniref:DUF488 domain-containing protein n=1 Tax=Nocardiopsis sp. NPDC006832 TaxID=3157188 RepID=UPI0033E17CFC